MEALKRAIPTGLRRWLSRKRFELGRKSLWVDRVTDFSALRRTTPYRPAFGWYRGQCIDRYYIGKFLGSHSQDIAGRVLEVAEPMYTEQFGGGKATVIDVIDLDRNNAKASIFDDLTSAVSIPDDTYDCVICTQTLLCIYDFRAAIQTMHRILKPGGVLLVTVPGIAQLCPTSMMGAGADYWRFTRHSIDRMFSEVFGQENLAIETFGNVLTAVAMLHGLVSAEFAGHELDYHDPDYEVTIGIRAEKAPR